MGSLVDVGKEFIELLPGAGVVQVLFEQVFDPFFHGKGCSFS
jgi:hypothetical protein